MLTTLSGERRGDCGSPGNPHTGEAFEQGKENSHLRTDRKDERTHKNSLADAERIEQKEKEDEKAKAETKPTDIAKSHGNKPSRGAEKDEELEDEDEAQLKKMDEAKEQSKAAHKKK